MGTTSEAEDLVRAGTMYPCRIGLRQSDGRIVLVGLRVGAFIIYRDNAPLYHFDPDGRWQRAVLEDGNHYLRGLNGEGVLVDRTRGENQLHLNRYALPHDAIQRLDERIRHEILTLREELDQGKLTPLPPPFPSEALSFERLGELLDRIGSGTAAVRDRERLDFTVTYQSRHYPWPFIPPSCRQPIVLQMTREPQSSWLEAPAKNVGTPRGHGTGTVTVTATDGGSSDVAGLDEAAFHTHTREVRRLWGERAFQARYVLATGPQICSAFTPEEMSVRLRQIVEVFPIDTEPVRPSTKDVQRPLEDHRYQGIHMFLADPSIAFDTVGAWETLRAHQVTRVHLGVVSGAKSVREQWGYSWDDAQLIDLVHRLKSARIGVDVLVVADAGGVRDRAIHEDMTGHLVESLPLGALDLIGIVDTSIAGGPNARLSREIRGISPVSPQESLETAQRWKERWKPRANANACKIAICTTYDDLP